MKTRGFLYLVFFVTALNLNAQNLKKQYSEMIVGTWKIDSLEIGNYKLSPEYEALVRQKLPEIIESTEVVFSKNKKYTKKGIEGVKTGTWDISSDAKYVLVKLDGETKVSKTVIVQLNDNKLIMAPDDPNSVNSKVYMYKSKKE